MAIVGVSASGTALHLSSADTIAWSNRAGSAWPASTLCGRSVFAEFDARGDLVDLVFNGGRGEQDCDPHEFDACVADHLPAGHPAVRAGAL